MTNTLNKIMHNGDEYDLPEWFTPESAWTTWDMLYKTANGYDWDTAPEETVVSGDSGTTYTIKVANSDPSSWTPATTITFVS